MGITIERAMINLEDEIARAKRMGCDIEYIESLEYADMIMEDFTKIEEIVNSSDEFIRRDAEYKLQEIREVLNGNDDRSRANYKE